MERHFDKWPDTESVVSRLRHWLDETRSETEGIIDDVDSNEPPFEKVGLFQVQECLTSLRHEVKLLTKASRRGEERAESTLLSMQAAIEQFGAIEATEQAAAKQAVRPLVEGLIDLDESLCRGRQAIEAARRRLFGETRADLDDALQQFEKLYKAQPWWRRVMCGPWHAAVKDAYTNRGMGGMGNAGTLFDAMLEGYDLIQSRLQRKFEEQSILRMQCVGHLVDPNSMTVVESISDLARPPGLVVEEVRTGYYWETKVFRFAEVKAVGAR